MFQNNNSLVTATDNSEGIFWINSNDAKNPKLVWKETTLDNANQYVQNLTVSVSTQDGL